MPRRTRKLLDSIYHRPSEDIDRGTKYDLNDKWTAVSHLITRVTGSTSVPGNFINTLQGIDHIHDAMISDIERSSSSIFLSTYIFKNDDYGRKLADALIEAKRRGVDVKILLDGVGNGLFRSKIYRRLKSGHVDVRRFLHSIWPWKMPLLNLRNHRKVLIIDEEISYIGSMNIGRVKNMETQFRMRGHIATNLTEAFEADWIIAGGGSIQANIENPFHLRPGKVDLRVISSGPVHKLERLRWVLLGVMGAATRRIRIVTPYFVPDRGLLSGLILASLRGVQVEIYLPRKSNYIFVDWASRRQIEQLVQSGCNIYYLDGAFDHSKIMTVDDQWALFGSSNWDARSMRLNFELDIVSKNTDFAHSLNGIINEKKSQSVLISSPDLKDTSWLIRLRDALARLLLPYL